jgi:hypothetical protein
LSYIQCFYKTHVPPFDLPNGTSKPHYKCCLQNMKKHCQEPFSCSSSTTTIWCYMLQSKTKFCKTFSICKTLSTWEIYTLEIQIWNPSKIKCFCNKVEGITMTKPLYSLEFPIKIRKQVENTQWRDVGYA